MTSLLRRSPALALLASFGLAAPFVAPRAVRAQDAQEQPISPQQIQLARQAASEGLTAYRAGEFDKALNLFEQAKALYPSAQIVRMLGYSLLALERWMPAAEAMEAALVSKIGPLSEDDRKDVQDQLAKAMLHISRLNVTASAPGAKLSVDDQPAVALPLEASLRLVPGRHKIEVSAPEHEDRTQELDLEGGKELALDVELDPIKKVEPPKPAPLPPPPPPKKKGWFPHQRAAGVGLAAGGVGVGLGALATGLTSLHISRNVDRDKQIHEAEYGTDCSRGELRFCNLHRQVISADARDANALKTWTLGLGIGAGVLVATGVVFVVFSDPGDAPARPKDEAPPPAATGKVLRSLSCGPLGGAGLQCAGTF